jgi:hypothetical protein
MNCNESNFDAKNAQSSEYNPDESIADDTDVNGIKSK